MQIIRISIVIHILTLLGCMQSSRDALHNINVRVIDTFVYMPNEGESDFSQMQLTLVFANSSSKNLYIELDSWLGEQRDSLLFEITTLCENGNDSVGLPLAYITSPVVYLDGMETDTIALKVDFRQLDDYFRNCLKVSSAEEAEGKLKTSSIYYESKKHKKELNRKAKKYLPVTEFQTKI